MKTKSIIKSSLLTSLLMLVIVLGHHNAKASITSYTARNFINKTSFIIGEAYDIVYYYNFYTSGNLSKAVNHQNYAKYLYNRNRYILAIYHSDLARKYALNIIYNCNNYWHNYYRPYYYNDYGYYHPSNPRPPKHYGHHHSYYNNPKHRPNNNSYGNKPNHGNYGNKPNNNNYYGHPSYSSGINATNKLSKNNNPSKFTISSSGNITEKQFDNWYTDYYTAEEKALITNAPSEKELNLEVTNNINTINRVTSDKEVITKGISGLRSDISSYKSEHKAEAQQIAIKRPDELGTNAAITRTTTAPKEINTSTTMNRSSNTNAIDRSNNTNAVNRPNNTNSSNRVNRSTNSNSSSTNRSNNTTTIKTNSNTSNNYVNPNNKSNNTYQKNNTSATSNKNINNQTISNPTQRSNSTKATSQTNNSTNTSQNSNRSPR